jgi:hypothetical protein
VTYRTLPNRDQTRFSEEGAEKHLMKMAKFSKFGKIQEVQQTKSKIKAE